MFFKHALVFHQWETDVNYVQDVQGVCSVDHPQLLQRVQQALLDFSE